MSYQDEQPPAEPDPLGETLSAILKIVFVIAVALVALPLVVPTVFARGAQMLATKQRFWIVTRWQWIVNTIGAALVGALLAVETVWLTHWISSGDAAVFFDSDDWGAKLLPMFGPWLALNLLSGVLLLPLTWSIRRRQIAREVRTRRVSDVVRQERIETARKRAADAAAARRMGVQLDSTTGRITGATKNAVTVPLQVGGRQAFGMITHGTVKSLAESFHDARRVPDWVDPTGRYAVLPESASAVRALLVAESGVGKTVFINGAVLCALEAGWPVFMLDAKGDPDDAEKLVALAESYGHTAVAGGQWNLFDGTAEQVTAKLMRLMPPPDGANQHYLDEIRGVLQAVQDRSPITGVDDLRERLTNPNPYVRDNYDFGLVTKPVDRTGETAGTRALQSLMVALRPLERWISAEGWSYSSPKAALSVVPLSPVDEAQARLGDLLMLDLRNFIARRLESRDKTPALVIVDEFPQLVTGAQDPGDTASSLFETARSAGMGLILAVQSPAGVSNDDTRRRRALTSGAALIFGRSKDPEDIVKYAGTVMRMEASGRATGEELGTARAQHSFVIPPQDVREASAGSYWIVQGGAIAPFRSLPTQNVVRPATGLVTEATSNTVADKDVDSSDSEFDSPVAEESPTR
ncbi:type IV secretory system conjugative DNA transfer family protein [Herbiconiux daphne]|uniref:TraD/TraG TraM recognition site domain-containing protein n=1 Tax=Herbiconiux daphne TaxID=2970914 RepID=A0ABT2GZD0_9MICO|nr:hypothetical protein [Herbiconiux daphne]MCS5732415.1 hypothetical protein [Herbiconiux daphne]